MGIFAGIAAAFTGPLGTILSKILMVVFAAAVLFGLYFLIVHTAKVEQKAVDQGVILQQVVKDQKDFIDKTQQIITDQTTATNNLNDAITKIQTDTSTINTELNNPDLVKKDRPASDILKNVVKDLSGQQETTQTKTIKKLR